uniref:Galectin n=1 Tax=Caenorhabditis japonica TaxID=281687 RepID=A0A8R1ITV6_CAEJA
MFNLSKILILLLFRDSLSLFLRVETGHENIAIDGRDTYYGHYTEIHFHNVTCIDAIDIHCLKELTGAEEIDLLYSECAKGHWKVAHYTNSKHHFRLKEPIHAQRLLISSRLELSVIDAQVESCSFLPPLPSDCHRPTRTHNHRHGKDRPPTIRAVDRFAQMDLESDNVEVKQPRSRRFRRSLEGGEKDEEENIEGLKEFSEDKVVPHGHTLRISAGATLKFRPETGLVVYGILRVDGTAAQPITFDTTVEGQRWKGIEFRNVTAGSALHHVKISGSDVAVRILGGVAPDFDHVAADGNAYGIQMDQLDENSSTHMVSVVTTNNEKTGVEYLGKGAISIDRMVTARMEG